MEGCVCEGEINNPRWPRYLDVLHPVQVVRYNEYICRSLPFNSGKRTFSWLPEELHEPRDAEPVPQGTTNVHVRIRNRRVCGQLVDGLHSEEGVWVKARVIVAHNRTFLVEVPNWTTNEEMNRTDQRMRIYVSSDDIRPTKGQRRAN